jgi:putative ABC transport system permease protein
VGADLLADGRLTFVAGDRGSALIGLDAGGTVILPRSLADRIGLKVGDSMAFTVAGTAPATLAVRGIVDRTLPGSAGETMLVGWPDATGRFGVQGADFFAVRFEPGQAATARPALEAAATTLGLDPNPLDRVQGAVADALGQVFSLFDALAAVAVLVAGLGIVNTLTMNVFERVREIGVLRATGMTRRQVWRMVVVEAGVLGVVGAVLGSITGLAAGAAMVLLAGGGALSGSLDIPWVTIAIASVFGVAIAMLAAYYPARLASGLSIVRAVQFE